MVISCVVFALWFLLFICHCVLVLQVFILFRRENYYMQKLGKIIKESCMKCCASILKRGPVEKKIEADVVIG
jgi:hypothetical protein